MNFITQTNPYLTGRLKFTFEKLSVISRRLYSNKIPANKLARHRNIGIMAHVDAGKTTTTERMLFYSGEISVKGEVHHGTTVTDYMEQERDRGISITSAFVKFKWKDYVMNLVDTPGHIDFTAEVENALGVIDSAILVLDSSAGVEAQTTTVWGQIQNYKLPCLIYINKMDRMDADVDMCLKSLISKLHCEPIFIQLPLFKGKSFKGVVDLPSLDSIEWGNLGKSNDLVRKKLNNADPQYKEAIEKRIALVDKLSSLNDNLANLILERGSLDSITQSELVDSIRETAILGKIVPVVCGSSYKDIGVQLLLDSIIDFMPSPHQTQLAPKLFSKGDYLLKSFKIIHDKQRGPITFTRVYSGEVSKGQRLYNVNKEMVEQVGKTLVPFADDFEEIPSGNMGDYIAITGLKQTHPGEILTNSEGGLKRIKSHFQTQMKITGEEADKLILSNKKSLQPVFFCSVEVESQAYQQALEKALTELQREDPSLGVTYDAESGQTILSGMGELHLDIIRDRLRTHYKLDVDMGKVQIMYKEKIMDSAPSSYHLINKIGTKTYEVQVRISLIPTKNSPERFLILDTSAESASNLAHVTPKQLTAIERGVKSALNRGPVMSCPVIDCQVKLHWFESKRSTPEQLLSAAASHCARRIMDDATFQVLEPVMSLDVTVPLERAAPVLADLGQRRAKILKVEEKGDSRVIESLVPTAELVGYSTALRIITSGTASLIMAFSDHWPMTDSQINDIKQY